LTYAGGTPFAVLYWINSAGIRVPITVELDPKKLRKAAGAPRIFFYKGVTVDPRYVDAATVEPLPPF
jgi:hypothetical protein